MAAPGRGGLDPGCVLSRRGLAGPAFCRREPGTRFPHDHPRHASHRAGGGKRRHSPDRAGLPGAPERHDSGGLPDWGTDTCLRDHGLAPGRRSAGIRRAACPHHGFLAGLADHGSGHADRDRGDNRPGFRSGQKPGCLCHRALRRLRDPAAARAGGQSADFGGLSLAPGGQGHGDALQVGERLQRGKLYLAFLAGIGPAAGFCRIPARDGQADDRLAVAGFPGGILPERRSTSMPTGPCRSSVG